MCVSPSLESKIVGAVLLLIKIRKNKKSVESALLDELANNLNFNYISSVNSTINLPSKLSV